MDNLLKHLIEKRIVDAKLTEKTLWIKTLCGIEETIHVEDLFGVFAKFSGEKEKYMAGKIIEDISINKNGSIHFGFPHDGWSVYVVGLKEIVKIETSEDKKEVLITADFYKASWFDQWKILYVKSGDEWHLSKFGTSSYGAYECAKKYDLINHPSVRLLTVFK
jgi:hypothetical protein